MYLENIKDICLFKFNATLKKNVAVFGIPLLKMFYKLSLIQLRQLFIFISSNYNVIRYGIISNKLNTIIKSHPVPFNVIFN